MSANPAPNPQVTLVTSQGTIKLELYPDKAPVTVKNFLDYVNSGFFNNTVFHRVIPNFMIQGGGFEPGMRQKPTKAAIKNEAANGLKNDRGTVAMARTSDPDSATSQFFINHKDNAFLNKAQAQDGHGYCVFGKVVAGLDVVDKISAVPTGRKAGQGDVPVNDVVLQSASVVTP
jgi:cyclophilin family peptidyl-prolyl cis-trans isomerase